MRNTITIFDGDKPRPRFRDLEAGQMFRYPNADPHNVYMKVSNSISNLEGVLLATGSGFSIGGDKEVEVVTAIRITR